MSNEEAINLLETMRRNNDRLLKQAQDVERIAAFELLNSALAIAIEATEKGSDLVDLYLCLYEKAFETVLNDHLAPELVKKIIRETTLEYCRQVSKQEITG